MVSCNSIGGSARLKLLPCWDLACSCSLLPAMCRQPAAATAAKSSHQALSPPGIKEPEIQPAGPSTPGTIAGIIQSRPPSILSALLHDHALLDQDPLLTLAKLTTLANFYLSLRMPVLLPEAAHSHHDVALDAVHQQACWCWH